MSSSPRRLLGVALVAAGLLGLAGCGGAAPAATPDAAVAAGPTAYPLTLDTAYGTSVLPAAPTRVVSLGDLDDALAVGVVPVGSFRSAGDTDQLLDYQQKALEAARATSTVKDVETLFDPYAEPDYEAIAKLRPDVILAAGYWDLSTSYARLSQIAPVVALPKDVESTWESRHRIVAKALDRAPQGEAVIARVEQAFADARAANPQFAERTLTYAVVYPTQVTYMSVPDTEASWFFGRLGFRTPAGASAFGAEYPADVVSEERTSLLDADVVVIGYHSLLEPGQREKFERSPLFAALPAVRGGHYLPLPPGHDSTIPQPGVLSSLNDLDAVLPLLHDLTT